MRLLGVAVFLCAVFFVLSFYASIEKPIECPQLRCWDGIVVGKTTVDQAMWLLQDIHGENVQLHEVVPADGLLYMEWWQVSDPEAYGSMIANGQGVIRQMEIYFEQPYPRLGDVIAQYGKPSTMSLSRTPSCMGIKISYHNGIDASLLLAEPVVDVHPNQYIRMVLMLPENTLPLYREADILMGIDWQGYVDYCELLETTEP